MPTEILSITHQSRSTWLLLVGLGNESANDPSVQMREYHNGRPEMSAVGRLPTGNKPRAAICEKAGHDAQAKAMYMTGALIEILFDSIGEVQLRPRSAVSQVNTLTHDNEKLHGIDRL
jgi:hypothetical protein